jgi:CRAL/TRIO, N-terminal domain
MLTLPRRYLRARKFDVNGAIGQFSDTEHWLKEQRVEELYEHYDVEIYERARKMVHLSTCGSSIG